MYRIIYLLCLFTFSCGNPQKHRRIQQKIVGGQETTIENYPYQLSLRYAGNPICGASLIAPNMALTAGHCTYGFSPSLLTIKGGSTYLNSGGHVANVKEVCQHPKYEHDTYDYDVAVLNLHPPFKFSTKIKEVNLQPLGKLVATDDVGTVTGWGTLNPGSNRFPEIFQEVYVSFVSTEECAKNYDPYNITDRMICFGDAEGGKDACQGDSGGPLVVNNVQVGIVSWGKGCGYPQFPGVYTNIADYEIRQHINNCINKYKPFRLNFWP